MADHENEAAIRFRRRRRIHRILTAAIFVAAAWGVGMQYAGAFGFAGDEWMAFNHRTFVVTALAEDDSIQIGPQAFVRLLGISIPPADAARAKVYLSLRLIGHRVTVLMENSRGRERDGQLPAYLFDSDGDNLNVDLVAAGLGRPDPRDQAVLSAQISAASKRGPAGRR